MNNAPGAAIVSSRGAAELLALFLDGESRTRSQIATTTGWARKTVESRLGELETLGLIRIVAEAHTGGRPSATFALVPDARLILVLDIGASHATVGVTDLQTSVLASRRERTIDLDIGPEEFFTHLIEIADELLAEVGRGSEDVAAICAGLPSPVDRHDHSALNPVAMSSWTGVDVAALIAAIYPVAVLVENDVNLMAYGEWRTSHAHASDLIFVKVATWVGAGIISGRALQRGTRGIAGDIGHLAVQGSEVPCTCGHVGCLGVTAALPRIAERIREAGVPLDTDQSAIAAAANGESAALQSLRQAGRDIGSVLVHTVSLLNPSHVVIGGPWSGSAEHLIAGVRESIYGRAFPLTTETLSISRSKTGVMAALHGGSALALQELLSRAGARWP